MPVISLAKNRAKERPALTPTQIEKVFNYADNPSNYNLHLIHCAMNLAFAGSMRGGEIGGLQWEDIVDEQKRILYIHKSINRVNKKALEKVAKTEIYFKFLSYTPCAKLIIVLKNTKEDGGSDRNCYLPEVVFEKLMRLRQMQTDLKEELGNDIYFDYNLIIYQETGKPVMTEHRNKKFQEELDEDRIRIAETMNNDFYRKDEIKSEEIEMMSAIQNNM